MLLQAEGVSKRFGGLMAVDDVSLGIHEGEVLGLIGPNGAGKTTLLNVLAGVYRPERGSIRYRDQEITGLSVDRVCKRGISRTFQISRPFPKMTVLENVMVAAVFGNRQSIKDPRAWCMQKLQFVEFPATEHVLAQDLNTAQLKRLDLARALASSPGLLLLDELAAGLTPSELVDLMGLICRIADSGVAIIAVEHLLKMIMKVCDRIAVLQQGKKIAEGTPAQIAADQRVIEAYLGDRYLL